MASRSVQRAQRTLTRSGRWCGGLLFRTDPIGRSSIDHSWISSDAPTPLSLLLKYLRATVGYLLASHHGTFFANGPVAWIEELMVSESVRRQGVATRLMESAETWAQSVTTAHVALASRRAGDFYLGAGYKESATYF